MTTTATMRTHHAHPGRARRRPDLRRPAQRLQPEPVLLLIGSPMGAAGFGTLAGHFTDRTVVTYDPRGVGAQRRRPTRRTQSTPDSTPTTCIGSSQELGGGPVDLFASSGGAVNALALVAKHPEDVRTLVAHEPPLAAVAPDREAALAAARAVRRHVPAQRLGCRDGAVHRASSATRARSPPTSPASPRPDPAMFGMPTEDDGSRNDVLLGQNMITCTHYELDFDALRAASTRIVIAVGAESERRAGPARRRGRRGAAGHDAGDLPERPRRLPGRRVRPDRASPMRSPRSCARCSRRRGLTTTPGPSPSRAGGRVCARCLGGQSSRSK